MRYSLTTLVTFLSHLDHTGLKNLNLDHQEISPLQKRRSHSAHDGVRHLASDNRRQRERMTERHILLGNSLSTVKTKINRRQQRNRKLVMFTVVKFGITGSLVCRFLFNWIAKKSVWMVASKARLYFVDLERKGAASSKPKEQPLARSWISEIV